MKLENVLRKVGNFAKRTVLAGTSYLGSITLNADNLTVNIIVSRDGNISFFNSSGSEKMRIVQNGNVGIGTTSPTTIQGYSGSTGTILNVVEGTQEARLVAQGANGARFDLVDTGGGSDDKWLTFIVDAGIGRFVSISDNGLSVISDDILVMDLGTGNVGINDTNPQAKLQVNGSGTTAAFMGGKVGIGTTTPNHKLEVNGNMNVSNLNISGDFDNDGFEDDVAVLAGDGIVYVYNASGNITWESPDLGDRSYVIESGDLDSDGLEDDLVFSIRFGGSNYGIIAYNTTNGTGWVQLWNSTAFTGDVNDIALVDWDGDGIKDDVAAGRNGGPANVFNETGGILESWDSQSRDMAGIDHDGDGIEDAMVIGGDGYVEVVDDASNRVVYFTGPNGRVYEVETADLDGDGIANEIVAGDDASIFAFDDGLSGFPSGNLWEFTPPSNYLTSLSIGDIDNDNEIEIIAGYFSDGNVWVLNRTGGLILNYTTGSSYGQPSGSGQGTDIADFDNDNLNEIITIDDDGNVNVYEMILPCYIYFNDTDVWQAMWYNRSVGLYYYNRTFTSADTYNWSIRCNNTDYEIQDMSSTVDIVDCNPQTDQDWIITQPTLCSNLDRSLGTGKITINAGGKLYLDNNANVTCSGLELNTTGDRVFIKSGSELRVS